MRILFIFVLILFSFANVTFGQEIGKKTENAGKVVQFDISERCRAMANSLMEQPPVQICPGCPKDAPFKKTKKCSFFGFLEDKKECFSLNEDVGFEELTYITTPEVCALFPDREVVEIGEIKKLSEEEKKDYVDKFGIEGYCQQFDEEYIRQTQRINGTYIKCRRKECKYKSYCHIGPCDETRILCIDPWLDKGTKCVRNTTKEECDQHPNLGMLSDTVCLKKTQCPDGNFLGEDDNRWELSYTRMCGRFNCIPCDREIDVYTTEEACLACKNRKWLNNYCVLEKENK